MTIEQIIDSDNLGKFDQTAKPPLLCTFGHYLTHIFLMKMRKLSKTGIWLWEWKSQSLWEGKIPKNMVVPAAPVALAFRVVWMGLLLI